MGYILPGVKKRTGRVSSLSDLQAEADELQAQAVAFGAPTTEEDKPGVFSTVLDLIGRSNYAIAGGVEEALRGGGVGDVLGRGATELLSGVGGLQGQKRAFGQVLEGQGFGTVTLADVFPVLDKTWVGALGSRGAAGLTLDILTDPLTYLTFGTSTAAKQVFKRGTVFLSKAGRKSLGDVAQGFQKEIDEIAKLRSKGDIFGAQKATYDLDDKIETAFFERHGSELTEDLVDPGGVHLAGMSLVKGSTLARGRSGLATAVATLPGGKWSLEGAAKLGEGLRVATVKLFHPNGELGNLPAAMKGRAIRLQQDFANMSMALRQRTRNIAKGGLTTEDGGEIIAEDLVGRYTKLLAADPEIGRKLYEVKYGRKQLADLSPEAQTVYQDWTTLVDMMRDNLVNAGILTADDIRLGYFPSRYKNTKEVLDLYHIHQGGKFKGSLKESLVKSRVFDDPFEAEKVSAALEKVGEAQLASGKPTRLFKKLEPEFDLLKNFNSYVDQYADLLARKTWRDQVSKEFGKDVSKFDMNALYEVLEDIPIDKEEAGKITIWLGETYSKQPAREVPSFRKVREEFARHPGKRTLEKGAATEKMMESASKMMRGLSDDGKRMFLRRLIQSADDQTQVASVVSHLWDEFSDHFDTFRTINEGDKAAPYAKLFGNDAGYIPVAGPLNGSTMLIPKIIWEDMERVQSSLFNTADHTVVKKMLRGFDWFNNTFKLGVYAPWPASAVRDLYSNVANAALDIGVSAFSPAKYANTIGIMAGRTGELVTPSGVRYQWSDLKRMAKDMGVWAPARVLHELTGEQALATGPVRKLLRSAAEKRATIDNTSKMQLWVSNIMRGVDPRQAADHVRDFLFDYSELSKVEREALLRVIPFYTFTRKNIELQVKTLLKNPGRQANLLKPFRQRDDESGMMVKWEREALGLRLNRDGKTIQVLNGIDLPLRNLDSLWAGGIGASGRRIMGMVTPALKVPLEAITGRDFFTGGDNKRAFAPTLGRMLDSRMTPKAVKDWIGFKKEVDATGRKTYTLDGVRYSMLVKSWAFSRLFTTSDRQFREYVDDRNIAAGMLDMLTGIRSKDIDLDEQQKKLLARRIKELEASLERRGVRVRYTKTYDPKTERKVTF